MHGKRRPCVLLVLLKLLLRMLLLLLQRLDILLQDSWQRGNCWLQSRVPLQLHQVLLQQGGQRRCGKRTLLHDQLRSEVSILGARMQPRPTAAAAASAGRRLAGDARRRHCCG